MRLTKEQIIGWVSRHFEFKTRKGDREIRICNPFDDDTRFKLNISTQPRTNKKGDFVPAGAVYDWRPGHQQHNGFIVKFIQAYKDLSYYDAVRDICGKNVDIKALAKSFKEKLVEETQPEIKYLELPGGSVLLSNNSYPTARKNAIRYLLYRGLNQSDVDKYKIHYNSTEVVFPYYEFDEMCYWQSRNILIKQFAFPSSEIYGVNKSDFLFGLDLARHDSDVVITESIFDAISVGGGCLASGGADIQDRQVRKLRILQPTRIILAPDNDGAGISSIISNSKSLSPYYEVWYCLPPDGYKDWNDCHKVKYNCMKYIIENVKKMSIRESIKLFKIAKKYKKSNI